MIPAVVPSADISAITLFHISRISVSSFLTAPPTPSPKTPPENVGPVNATSTPPSTNVPHFSNDAIKYVNGAAAAVINNMGDSMRTIQEVNTAESNAVITTSQVSCPY